MTPDGDESEKRPDDGGDESRERPDSTDVDPANADYKHDQPHLDDVDGPNDVDDEELEDLIEDLEDLEETAETAAERRTLRRTRRTLDAVARGRVFGLDDLVQQVVGGVLLSAPFVVTEEVWTLADAMNAVQWAVTVLLVLAIGYATLYRAEDEHDPDSEESLAGLPVRFVSLVAVAYLSVVLVALLFDAPDTFDATLRTSAKAVSISAVFSVVGAATADSLFG